MLPPIASATGQMRIPKGNLNNYGSPEASSKILYEDYPSLAEITLSKSQSIQYDQKVSKKLKGQQMKSYDLHQSPAVGN